MGKRIGPEQLPEEVTLDDLFPKGESIEDSELARVLKDKITLAAGTDRVFITKGFRNAGDQRRLVAVGLGRHVLRRKGLIKDEDLAKSREWFSDQAQVKPKTAFEQLSRLKAQGIFDRGDQGYFIPLWAMRKALDFLAE